LDFGGHPARDFANRLPIFYAIRNGYDELIKPFALRL